MRIIDDYSHYNVILWKKNGVIRHYDMLYFSLEFLEDDFDYTLFLKFDFPSDLLDPNINNLTIALESIFAGNQDTFILLTPRKNAPILKESPDEFIHSFSCNFHHFKKLVIDYRKSEFLYKNMLFELLDQIFKGKSLFQRLMVKQIPFLDFDIQKSINNFDVIIPHRGDNAYLENLLFFLSKIDNLNINIGIDQKVTADMFNIRKDYPKSHFYNFSNDPVGPYVIRNYLINHSFNDLIFFQDSDDISCGDRFDKISDHIFKTECQLCGSHEIRLDYFDKTVRAIRYPLNVVKALEEGPGHSILHPSSAIQRSAYYLNGRLSEERIFGNDTKFLYHALFKLHTIQNVDEFLYIRRRRLNSLTTSPATIIGSPVRMALLNAWINDFRLVKAGKLKLEESRLKYQPSRLKTHINKF